MWLDKESDQTWAAIRANGSLPLSAWPCFGGMCQCSLVEWPRPVVIQLIGLILSTRGLHGTFLVPYTTVPRHDVDSHSHLTPSRTWRQGLGLFLY